MLYSTVREIQQMNISYWTKTSSTLWCEAELHAYEDSYYIAESFNTLSSIMIILIGMYDLIYTKRNNYPYTIQRISACIWMVGIGSTIFHATQGIIGQWIDEIFMLAAAVSYFIALRETNSSKVSIMLWLLIITPLITHYFFIFSFIFLVVVIISEANKIVNTYKINTVNLYTGIILSAIAIFFWIPERMSCKSGSLSDVCRFHALWHIFSALSTHYFHLFICECYADVKNISDQEYTIVEVNHYYY